MLWSTIVLLQISNGNSFKRHILNTIDFQLINFLEDIYYDKKIIKIIIYNSLKNNFLSNIVPLELYNKVLDINHELYLTQFHDIEGWCQNIDLGHYLSKFIINNYYKSFNLLVDNYISIIKKDIVNLSLNIEEFRNKLSELKNSLKISDDLTKVKNNLRKSILDCENEVENLYSEKSKKEDRKSVV